MKPFGTGFVFGGPRPVILFQETREFVPIEPAPACPQANEKLEFAACEYRHANPPPGQRRAVTSFACRRIASRCKGQHKLPSACIVLSLPDTPANCTPARWTRKYTRPHMRCRCGDVGSRPAILPSCIDKSALHQTTRNTCRPFCWLTPELSQTTARCRKWRATRRQPAASWQTSLICSLRQELKFWRRTDPAEIACARTDRRLPTARHRTT